MGNTSVHTELRVVNDTSTDIIKTQVGGIDNYDWDGGSRPDHNFQNVHIAAKSSAQRREEINARASNCPFTMTLVFRDGSSDTFTIHQRHAIGCCAGFNHSQRSHDIFYYVRGGAVLEIVVKNTQAQLNNEKAEQLNREAQASMGRAAYQEAINKLGQALQQANQDHTKNSILNNQKTAYGTWGMELLNQAWAAEESDKWQEAKAKFGEAKTKFDQAQDQNRSKLVQNKIAGNELFNQANDLEKQAHEMFETAKSASEHNTAQEKYREALVKYREAKSQFENGRKGDGKFESCVQLCKAAAEGVVKTIDNIEKIELSLNMGQVKIDDKDEEEKDLQYQQEDNLHLVIDS